MQLSKGRELLRKLSNKTKTIWLIIISIVLVGLAVLVWANQKGIIDILANPPAPPLYLDDIEFIGCTENGCLQKSKVTWHNLPSPQYHMFIKSDKQTEGQWTDSPIAFGLSGADGSKEVTHLSGDDVWFKVKTVYNPGTIPIPVDSETSPKKAPNGQCVCLEPTPTPTYTPTPTTSPTPSPTATSSPPIPLPTVVNDTCQMKCEERGYNTAVCREYAIIPENIAPDAQLCSESEIDVGTASDCLASPETAGMGYTCCCSNTASPFPTSTSITPQSTTTPLLSITKLISTGASLWFNLTIAILLSLALAYYMFRPEIWNRNKK